MKIKEVCDITGLTDRTIRYYIQCGLLQPDQKETYAGRKNFTFSRQDVERLESIKLLRQAGFSIEQIRACRDASDVTPFVQERLRELENEQQERMVLIDILQKANLDREVSEEELVVILSANLEKQEEPPAISPAPLKLPVWAIIATVFAMMVVMAVVVTFFVDIELFGFQYILSVVLIGLSLYIWIRKMDLPVCAVAIAICAGLILPTLIGNVWYRPSTLSGESYEILARVPWNDTSYFIDRDGWQQGDGEYECYYIDQRQLEDLGINYTALMADVQQLRHHDSLFADEDDYIAYKDIRVYEHNLVIYESKIQAWLGVPTGVNRYYEILTKDRAVVVHEYNYDSVDESYFEALLHDIDPLRNS